MKSKLANILMIVAGLFLFYSCQKSTFTPIQITYTVKVAAGNKVSIEYNSDQYFITGNRPPIEWISNGTTWFASRLAKQEEDYFIKVKYLDAPNLEDNFKVQVTFNDTNVVAKSINDSVVPVVELSGRVTN